MRGLCTRGVGRRGCICTLRGFAGREIDDFRFGAGGGGVLDWRF